MRHGGAWDGSFLNKRRGRGGVRRLCHRSGEGMVTGGCLRGASSWRPQLAPRCQDDAESASISDPPPLDETRRRTAGNPCIMSFGSFRGSRRSQLGGSRRSPLAATGCLSTLSSSNGETTGSGENSLAVQHTHNAVQVLCNRTFDHLGVDYKHKRSHKK